VVTAALFLLTYHLTDPRAATAQLDNGTLLLRVFLAMLPLLAVCAWWVVLSAESHEMAHRNLVRSLEKLIFESPPQRGIPGKQANDRSRPICSFTAPSGTAAVCALRATGVCAHRTAGVDVSLPFATKR
jgi:hypothetical protein